MRPLQGVIGRQGTWTNNSWNTAQQVRVSGASLRARLAPWCQMCKVWCQPPLCEVECCWCQLQVRVSSQHHWCQPRRGSSIHAAQYTTYTQQTCAFYHDILITDILYILYLHFKEKDIWNGKKMSMGYNRDSNPCPQVGFCSGSSRLHTLSVQPWGIVGGRRYVLRLIPATVVVLVIQ